MEQVLHRALGNALRQMLTPLVRIMLRAGVPCGAFVEQAKRVYVEVARAEFNSHRRKPSISHTAVVTGLTRKEVSRLWKLPIEAGEPAVDKYNRAARVISAWVQNPKYADARGGPASLGFMPDPRGRQPSFSELVGEASGDMPPRAVLDELVRVGAVEELRSGKHRLVEHAYVPAKGEEEKLTILGRDVAELLSTIDHNLVSRARDARFQRKVLYDNLPVECLPQLREHAAKASQLLLEELDCQMSAFDRDVDPAIGGSGQATASVGIYYYQDVTQGEKK